MIEDPDNRLSNFHVNLSLTSFSKTRVRPLEGGFSGRFCGKGSCLDLGTVWYREDTDALNSDQRSSPRNNKQWDFISVC